MRGASAIVFLIFESEPPHPPQAVPLLLPRRRLLVRVSAMEFGREILRFAQNDIFVAWYFPQVGHYSLCVIPRENRGIFIASGANNYMGDSSLRSEWHPEDYFALRKRLLLEEKLSRSDWWGVAALAALYLPWESLPPHPPLTRPLPYLRLGRR